MHSLAMYQLTAMSHETSHRAPDVPFTVRRAHAVMQFHVACRAKYCARKAAALQALVEAGRVVLSTIHPR